MQSSFRRPVAIVGATAAIAMIAGCSGTTPAADGPVELSIWSWSANLQPALDIWNEEHPDIQVTLETLPADLTTAYQKIFAGVEAGTAADVLQAEYMALPNFLSEGALADITDLVADQEGEYAPSAWDQVVVDGAVYGLPNDLGPISMYYNAELLAQYGFEVPTTWEEFEQVGLQLKEQTDGTVYIGAMQTNSPNNVAGLAWQAGAQWWGSTDDGWKVTIDDPATLEVADSWQRMVDEGLIWMWDNETVGQQMFSEGKIATVLYPSWWAPNPINMEVAPGTFGVAPMPTADAGSPTGANSGGSSWGITASSAHPEEAAEFITWFTQSEDAYKAINDSSSFSYPAATGLLDAAADRETPLTTPDGSGDVFAVFTEAADRVPNGWQWAPTTIATMTSLQDSLATLKPGSDFAAAIERLQTTAIKQLTDQGFPVVE